MLITSHFRIYFNTFTSYAHYKIRRTDMTVKQIRSTDGTGTLSYLLIDEDTKTAAIIDPNREDVSKILYAAKEEGVKITHILDTHTHADHYTGAAGIREVTGAKLYMHEQTKNKPEVIKNAVKFGIEDILNYNANIPVDVYVNDCDIINPGKTEIKVMHTPGHTDNHIAFLTGDALFTGDLLLIGQAGRSDLPGGNTSDQYDSIFYKVLELPGETKIYPGHDYEENEFAYLKDELVNNPFLKQRTKEEYIEFVKDFFPPFADAEGESGKVILQCGTKRIPQAEEGYKSINAKQLYNMINERKDLFLLDVRQPFELAMGKVEGVVNIPVSQLPAELSKLPSKDSAIVCICASGSRSSEAAHFLTGQGYSNVYNLEGGTFSYLAAAL
jgi:glyoxylase-like metal-dependent hydrolase (beta-lactamase superfamily II)/rhodanese-related sulfurtransferase